MLLQDLRYGARMLIKNPAFTLIAVLTLAIGIGANTTIFSVMNTVLFQSFPYGDSERLVMLWEHSEEMSFMMVSYPDFLDWKEQSTVFEEIGTYNPYRKMNLTGSGEPAQLGTGLVSSGMMDLLEVPPVLGRGFLPEEHRMGGDRVVLLSHGLWQQRFGADPSILNRSLLLDDVPYRVVGVMPPGFRFGSNDLWTPLEPFVDEGMRNRGNHPGLLAIGRVKDGIHIDQVRAEMSTITGRLEAEYPGTNGGVGATITSLREVFVAGIRPTLLILAGAVAFVLLIACGNVAHLLLARAASRRKEIAVRSALGAGRWHLVRQLLTESCLLSILGGGLGLLFATWGLELIQATGPGIVPRAGDIGIDPWVLIYTLLISLMTGLLFGLAPAVQAARTNLNQPLREGSWSLSTGGRRNKLPLVLVVTEIALSLVLLIGAGLLVRSLTRLQQVNPGFDSSHLVSADLTLPPAKYPDGDPVIDFSRRLVERVASLPAVETAAAVYPLPFGRGGWQAGITVEGLPDPGPGKNPMVDAAVITPGYFRTLKISLLKGRDFTEQDDAAAPPVVIVNRSMVQRFWPGEDPVGKRLKLGGFDSESPWLEVVGVVSDVKRVGLDQQNVSEIHLPYRQHPEFIRSLTLVARTATEPGAQAGLLKSEILALDPDQPVQAVQTMDQLLESSLSSRRFFAVLLGLFAGVALVLAAIGLYGVVSYSVSRRTRELGIRMALGAARRDLLMMVIGQGFRLTLMGVAIGLAGALALSRVLSSFLFEISPTDPVTFVLVPALFTGVGVLACYFPARRATRVDPLTAVRCE